MAQRRRSSNRMKTRNNRRMKSNMNVKKKRRSRNRSQRGRGFFSRLNSRYNPYSKSNIERRRRKKEFKTNYIGDNNSNYDRDGIYGNDAGLVDSYTPVERNSYGDIMEQQFMNMSGRKTSQPGSRFSRWFNRTRGGRKRSRKTRKNTKRKTRKNTKRKTRRNNRTRRR